MSWKVEFYSTKVMNNISQWPAGIGAKFTRIVELIEELGPYEVGMPHIKPLGGGLFEIRAKGSEGIGRVLFCMMNNQVIVLLTGFIKKTQKTPPEEIKLARQRIREVTNEQKTTF